MAQPICRQGFSVAMLWGVMLVFTAADASAQSVSHSFTELETQVTTNKSISVTDMAGHKVVGKISDLSPASLTLLVGRQPQTFSEGQVQRIQQRRFDSLANGLLIGVGVGAAAGLGSVIYWWIADPNECSGGPCMEDMLVPTIMGGLIGVGVDLAIKTNVTLYEASPRNPSTRSVSSVLQVAQARKGLALTIRF